MTNLEQGPRENNEEIKRVGGSNQEYSPAELELADKINKDTAETGEKEELEKAKSDLEQAFRENQAAETEDTGIKILEEYYPPVKRLKRHVGGSEDIKIIGVKHPEVKRINQSDLPGVREKMVQKGNSGEWKMTEWTDEQGLTHIPVDDEPWWKKGMRKVGLYNKPRITEKFFRK